MRRSSTSSIGALHPILFFIFVYGISLALALFVCRTVYYSINGQENHQTQTVSEPVKNYSTASISVAALK